MASSSGEVANGAGEHAENGNENYKAPAQKSVAEILQADQEDESLQRYKAALLGQNAQQIIVDDTNPKNVIVRSLTLEVEGRPDVTMTLNEQGVSDIATLEKQTFTIKEGCHYRLRVNFHVQREIVSGLKYVQKVHRAGIQVDKDDFMVGSYGPKAELQSFRTPIEEAPSGMLHRGTYKVKSFFTDDDKNEWLNWSWTLELKKDWE